MKLPHALIDALANNDSPESSSDEGEPDQLRLSANRIEAAKAQGRIRGVNKQRPNLPFLNLGYDASDKHQHQVSRHKMQREFQSSSMNPSPRLPSMK